MSIALYIVDAFASKAFSGNPAAVCLLKEPAAAVWMQRVAGEMNLSETAFLTPAGNGYSLRWFTPQAEVKLCGHATLASAFVLWNEGHVRKIDTITFHTLSGVLAVEKREGGEIEMDFPAVPASPASTPSDLDEALGARSVDTFRSEFDVLVRLESADAVRKLRPDMSKLIAVDARGVIVTAPADENDEADFVSRFFAPRVGVPEDPVTGSAHCTLGPYWATEFGQVDLLGRQLSARGGLVGVAVRNDRVLLRGRAVMTVRGELVANPVAA
ncbi:PhzF family phenazine biosynthesis protein [soil metagenome]